MPVRGIPMQRSPKGSTMALLAPNSVKNKTTLMTPNAYAVHQQQCFDKAIPTHPACRASNISKARDKT